VIVVAGAGMAGLVAAARLRELGRDVIVHEKGTRVGGSMLLSSCVPWRHLEWEAFRQECPAGDPGLQRLVWERLDSALDWLQALGASIVEPTTGNPRTVGRRFDPRGLTRLLAARAGEIVLASDGCAVEADVTILCTGGFAASPELVARYVAPAGPLRLRAAPWSTGDGLEAALARGAATKGSLGEFYGRNMPDAAWGEDELVEVSQLYAAHARIFD
jgi:fumarate reductase flavoprotein subunit